jgi:GT2 family glycosyltransferase
MSTSVPLTVAVASCDRPEGVRRCLDGLLEGRVVPAEVLVVDQSRDDRVADVLRSSSTAPFTVRCLRGPRLGLSASRNTALEAATHALVAFTDDDCVPDRSWVATVYQALTADLELAGVTGRVLPLGDPRPGTFVVSPRYSMVPREYRRRAVPWAVGTGGNFAARREWLLRVGKFDVRLGAGSAGRAAEDADLLYRLLRAGATIRYDPGSIVYHERQTAAQRLASREGYGHGIGAFCALSCRRGDLYALRLLGSYLGGQAGLLARSAMHRDWFLARQRVRSLRGCAAGVLYGMTVR